MSVSERIRSSMFFLKKNGTELAKELGITKSTITRTLKGETLPSSKFLIPLGEKFNISIDWLLYGEGEMIRGAKKIDSNNNGHLMENTKQLDAQKIKSLEDQIELLKRTIKDKDEIIGLLKKNNN